MKPISLQEKSLVLIGCGHAHALALLELQHRLPEAVRLTLVDPAQRAVYSGMLPGFVAGHYERGDLDIEIANLAGSKSIAFVQDRVVAMDPCNRLITLAGGETLSYDVASLDVGITSAMPALPGFSDHAVPAKPLATFSERWRTYLESSAHPSVAVIGGGVAGTELIMAMSHAFKQRGVTGAFYLLDRGDVLTALAPTARAKVLRAMQDLGIEICAHQTIIQVTAEGIVREGLSDLAVDFVVGAAGATPHGFMAQTGLDLHNGFVAVNRHLQTSAPKVFATGDCAHFADQPLPKAGVYAVRQAPVLVENLIAALTGAPLRTYEPQSDYLKLISLGGKSAVAEKHGVVLSGGLIWQLKNYIDTGFMKRFA